MSKPLSFCEKPSRAFYRLISLWLFAVALLNVRQPYTTLLLAIASHGSFAAALYAITGVYGVGHGVCIIGLWCGKPWAILVSLLLLPCMVIMFSLSYCPGLPTLLSSCSIPLSDRLVIELAANSIIVVLLLVAYGWGWKNQINLTE